MAQTLTLGRCQRLQNVGRCEFQRKGHRCSGGGQLHYCEPRVAFGARVRERTCIFLPWKSSHDAGVV
ncbi:hypothetical protein HBI68_189020 [Parastagonospora nodorum]|nr:hypothetical protein HBH52_064080 [Parastagonospora nodorum]KAH6148749.1 hypothetical protein HBI68_189020 [Parastagonospora nodorum]